MKTKKDKNNPIIKTIKKWKKDQNIESLTFNELKKRVKDKETIIEQKVDGQSAILSYNNNSIKFGSLGGLIYTDLPVLKEIKKIFDKKDIHEAKIVGELAGMEKGEIIDFNDTQSLIKNPDANKNRLHWFPYQILSINNKKYEDDFQSYKKYWPKIKKLFKSAEHVHPVGYMEDDLEKAWNKFVEEQKNEGIVVRTSDDKVYKAKPEYTYDLVIIAVGDKQKKNWEKDMIGNTLMAFMDNNRIFRTAGEVGTGWSDKESKELFNWAKKNKVEEDEHYIWVKPKKIMEIEWERSHIKEMPSYKFSDNKYESVGKKLSGTIVKPRFIRYRTDKSVNPNDLRLSQIPDWEKNKKTALRIASTFLKYSDFPDNPDEIVISKKENIENLRAIKEIDVYNYYEGIKNVLIKELKGNDLFIVIKPNGKPVYIRHPYDKETEFIRINNEEEFEEYHSGRTVEYHITMPKKTSKYIIDYDPREGETWEKTKSNALEIATNMKKISQVKGIEIRYTGKRGFHIHGKIKSEENVEDAHNFLKEWLQDTFKDRTDLIIAESPTEKESALGLSPMKYNGGHIAKYSLRVSGLCCIEVPENNLENFEKKDASMKETYKQITGKKLKMKEAAKRVIESFLKGPIHEREMQRPVRLKERLKYRDRGERPSEFAKPGEMVEVLENGKWVKKRFTPSLKTKELRPLEPIT